MVNGHRREQNKSNCSGWTGRFRQWYIMIYIYMIIIYIAPLFMFLPLVHFLQFVEARRCHRNCPKYFARSAVAWQDIALQRPPPLWLFWPCRRCGEFRFRKLRKLRPGSGQFFGLGATSAWFAHCHWKKWHHHPTDTAAVGFCLHHGQHGGSMPLGWNLRWWTWQAFELWGFQPLSCELLDYWTCYRCHWCTWSVQLRWVAWLQKLRNNASQGPLST